MPPSDCRTPQATARLSPGGSGLSRGLGGGGGKPPPFVGDPQKAERRQRGGVQTRRPLGGPPAVGEAVARRSGPSGTIPGAKGGGGHFGGG